MTIESVNEKKMVSFRLASTLESDFRVVLAKHGIRGENMFYSFVETVLSFDAQTCPDYTAKAMSRIIERARQVRESKKYRAMYDLQRKIKAFSKSAPYVGPPVNVTEVSDTGKALEEIFPDGPLTKGKDNANDRKDNRSRSGGKTLHRS